MSAVPDGDPLSRFQLQSIFVQEADRLKGVVRRNYICDGGRLENTAEHSWHLALMVMPLAEQNCSISFSWLAMDIWHWFTAGFTLATCNSAASCFLG